MAKIRHLAIYTDDPDRLAQFHIDVFGLEKTQKSPSSPPPGRPYIEDAARDIDGNKFDLSTTGLRSEDEQVERDKSAREPARV
ncbi:MAG TPA: hypothetical protein VN802_13540 [Stellaceae bacterium]|nr:hypothetical protein [Stellaceae bacterium]